MIIYNIFSGVPIYSEKIILEVAVLSSHAQVKLCTNDVTSIEAAVIGSPMLINQVTSLWFVSWLSALTRWSLYSQAIWCRRSGVGSVHFFT